MSGCVSCDQTGWVTVPGQRAVTRCICVRPSPSLPPPLPDSNDPEVDVLAAFLREHAPGRRKALTRRTIEQRHPMLMARLSAKAGAPFERKLRLVASLANEMMIPVCTGNRGYYYGIEPADFDEGIERLRSQILQEQARLVRLKQLRDHIKQ